MAAADKLWFELGVRDEISGVLETLMRNSERLANALSDDAAELKNVYRNIVDVSNVYDKIYVSQKRISELKGSNLTREEKKGLKDMKKELEDVRKQFAAIFKNPDRLLNKGEVQFDKMRLNIELMLKDVLRYVDNIEAKEAAEAKNAVNESKRIDDLKGKYYELQRYRKQLSDAIINAAPGADLTSASSLINSISARMGAVSRAQINGKGLPASVTGADYEEFLRKVKAELSELTGATSDYNSKLEQNKQIQASLNKLKLDTVSQQSIAGIRKQSSEYTALGRKIQEIIALINNVQAEQAGLANGSITTPTWTRDKVTEELNAIQRRYNEALAASRQRELDDAAAKNQKTAATRKAMEAVSALAHVNQGLVSSYNRVAEAGSQANRITVQFQNQIGAYAGLYGLERILKSIVTIGGQFEVQHVALKNILGDVQEANILFGQLKELAIESPKTFMELTSYAKQLSAYQIPANELYETTKRLADMSSGLGVDMNRLILAYGQVRSAAVLRGQELRQFTEAGIPMVQALADKFTQLNGKLTTTADVFKLISARAVPFEMVKEVLWDMTSQGGQFFNMQEELANTLYGKWQKLQDSWQIMLGSIAEGTNASGMLFKWLLDIAVALTQNLDKMVFAFSALGAAKGIKWATEGLNNAVMRRTGDMAIRNMELAKIQEANRLERERLWNGRQLSAEEQQLVMNKNRLVSSDYQILALENQITAKKAHQLMLDGKMSQQHFYRYLQMQGYTREQRKQIALGNLQALNQGPNPQKLGIMGHLFGIGAGTAGSGLGKFLGVMGGWVGVAITALGVFTTIYEFISQSDERLSDLASSISGSAEQNANQLANTLKNVESSADEPFKKVEALEDALLKMGVAGKQVVQDSRGFDDMNERLENLTKNAQAYQQALEAMGTPQGKTAIMEALDNSDLNDELDEYEDLQNAEFKRMAALERYSAKYQQMIDAMKTKHKELNDELTSNNLYDNIRKLMTGSYANEAVGYFAGNTPWGEAITDYAKAVEESEAHLKNIKDNIIPDAMNALRALARQAGVDINKSYDQLTEEEKTKLRTIATNFANGLEKGSQDAKNSIASWVAQGFYAQLYLTPVLNVNDLTGLAYTLDQWQSGKGYGLWNKNDLKDANNNFLAFSKKQSQRKVDLEKTVKNFDSQLKNTLLRPDLIPTIQGQRQAVQAELDQLNASLSEGLWTFDKSLTKGNKGGSNTDKQLKRWKEEWDELKAFYSEYKKWAKEVGEDAALKRLRETGLWGQLFDANGALKYDVRNWGKAIDDFVRKNNVVGGTPERDKFKFSLGTAKLDVDLDVKKETLARELSELQEYLQRQASSWNLYKSLFEKTGDREYAMLAFEDGMIFDKIATEFADELKTRIEEKGQDIDVSKLWTLTDAAAKKQLEGIDGGYDLWKRIVDIVRHNYTDSLTKGGDAMEKILTAEEKVLTIETKLAELRDKYNNATTSAEKAALSAQIAGMQRDLEQAKRDAFKQSSDYLNFYNAILTLTIPQAEEIGRKIKENLNEELKAGKLSARQYLTEIKKINEQMLKLRNQQSDLAAFMNGGLQGYFNNRSERGENQWQRGVDDLAKFEKDFESSVKLYNKASAMGDKTGMAQAEANMQAAESGIKGAQAMMQGGQAMAEGANGAMATMTIIDKIIHGIDGVVQGLKGTFDEIREMYESLGYDTSKGSWADADTFLSSFSAASSSATKGWDSLKNGDIGGAIQGTIGSITNWITGFAKGRDKKLDSQIQEAKRLYDLTDEMRSQLKKRLDKLVGGIYNFKVDDGTIEYLRAERQRTEEIDEHAFDQRVKNSIAQGFKTSGIASAIGGAIAGPIGAITGAITGGLLGNIFGSKTKTYVVNYYSPDTLSQLDEALASRTYYDTQLAQLFMQRDQVVHQLQAELSKKDSDYDQVAAYQQSITTINDQLTNFARDMAETLYGIDFNSWASDLSEALVSAWAAGEDAAEAYNKKVSEILQNLGVSMITERFLANALTPIMDEFINQYSIDKGVLTEEGMKILAKMYDQADILDQQISTYLDGIESIANEHGESIKDSSSSSASNSIKSITESTADLLASYMNAIRADVSANRAMIAMYYPQFLTSMQQGNVIADAQLIELRSIVANTKRNADIVQDIYNILHGVAPDGQSIKVK